MKLKHWALVTVVVTIWLQLESAHALFEAEATFESFYTTKGLGWVGWVAAGAVAIGIGVAVFVTGGAASPLVPASVATLAKWIGGLGAAKLTGGAALNHGLALLGGGAIASGGLGTAGGAAVLSAVLAFGAEVPFFAAEVLYETLSKNEKNSYSYGRLLEESRDLATLPLPVNTSGSDAYEDAMEILEGVEAKKPLAIGGNRTVLKKAIHRLRWSTGSYQEAMKVLEEIDETVPSTAPENQEVIGRAIDVLLYDAEGISELEDATLLSLLYFVLNDYQKANLYANRAVKIAKNEAEDNLAERSNLPMFISATTALYFEEIDPSSVLSQIEDSIISDPENALVPLFFAVFLDRVELRMDSGDLDEGVLLQAFQVMKSPQLEAFRLENYVLLQARYLKRMENERQRIVVLANTSNSTIRSHPKTLEVVREALVRYRKLLDGSNLVESSISVLELADDIGREQVARLRSAFRHFSWEREKLASLAKELELHQSS